LTHSEPTELSKNLEENLALPIKPLTTQAITDSDIFEEVGALNAFGIGLFESEPIPVNFDLSQRRPKAFKMLRPSVQKKVNYKSVALVAMVCIPLIIIMSISLNKKLGKPKNEVAALSKQLGVYKDRSTEKMKDKNSSMSKKLAAFKTIHLESDISIYVSILPTLLPEGTWLKDLSISYGKPSSRAKKNKTGLSIAFSGYAYLENTKEQIRLVNDFLRNIKINNDFSETFDRIVLETFNTQALGDYTVTFFKITCS